MSIYNPMREMSKNTDCSYATNRSTFTLLVIWERLCSFTTSCADVCSVLQRRVTDFENSAKIQTKPKIQNFVDIFAFINSCF